MLILTQGVAYGLGFLILYYPILSMLNEYWISRRGMAYGVLCSAPGVSGAFMPFLQQAMLEKYGYRTTLRAVAVALAILTGPLIPFLKGRLPPSESAGIPKMSWNFFKSPLFWIYWTSNLLQALGCFFPALYLPSYASTLDLSSKTGALVLTLMSISQVCGQFAIGFLSDRKVSLDALGCLSTTVAAFACLCLWRLATSLPLLALFAIVYGFFGTGLTAIWARWCMTITDDVTAGLVIFTLLSFGKGVGNVLAGPIGGLLVFNPKSPGSSPSNYRWVIAFTGSCMFASSCIIWLRYLRHLCPIIAR